MDAVEATGQRTMDHLPGEDYPAQIKRLRACLGLTQAALAKKLGVSFPTINRWENVESRF